MSSLVDIADDITPVGNSDNIVKQLSESVAASGSNTEIAPSRTSADTTNLPDKLKGKTLEDIASMYVNLESTYGRMANDLGQQRKLTDRLLDLKRAEDLGKQTPKAEDVKTSDLLENPTQTLEKFASQRDRSLKETYDERIQRLEGSLAQSRFEQKHSDYQTVANDPAFVQWVQKSNLRTRAAQAAYNGDWTAADELLTEYKAQVGSVAVTAPKSDDSADANLKAAKAAGLDSSGASADAKRGKGGKVYSRAELLNLRLRDPDTYYNDAFQSEILLAHSEGRVK